MCLLRLAVDIPSPWSRKQTGANSATKWPEAEASFVQGPSSTSPFPLKKQEQEYFPGMPVERMIWNVNLLEYCKVCTNVHLNNHAFEVCCRTRGLCPCVFTSSVDTEEGDCAPGLRKSEKVREPG